MGTNLRSGLLVPAVAEANCLRVGFSISNHLFNAAAECLAFLLHSTEAQGDGCKREGRDNSGRDLDDAVGQHCFFLSATAALPAAGSCAGVLVGHGRMIFQRTIWNRNVLCRNISEGITDQTDLLHDSMPGNPFQISASSPSDVLEKQKVKIMLKLRE